MVEIIPYHIVSNLTGRDTKISPRPKVSSPIALFYVRKFLKKLTGTSSFDSSHYLTWCRCRGCRHKNMDMIFTDNTSQNMNLKTLAGLSHKFSYAQGEIAVQQLIAILGSPNKMVLYLEFCMTSLAVFHAKEYKATASIMLPA